MNGNALFAGFFVVVCVAIFVFFMCVLYLPHHWLPERLQILQARLTNMIDDLAVPDDFQQERRDERSQISYAQLAAIYPNQENADIAYLISQADRQDTAIIATPVDTESWLTAYLLAAEVELRLGFTMDIQGETALFTRHEYRLFEQYCAFRFDEILTPEQALARVGLKLRRYN